MNFKSDTTSRVNKKILNAILEANDGVGVSYGADDYSLKLKEKFSEIFQKPVEIFLTSTGTAANSLALSALVKAYQSIVCHSGAHINVNECAAPSFFTGGSNLLLINGQNGKIDPIELEEKLEKAKQVGYLAQKPGCISVTQGTELGTVYSLDELSAISEIAKRYKLPIHMDGARFANSLVSLDCSPAKLTWKVGVDVMSFGATKNGCLCAEVIIFFNQDYAKDFQYLQKRSGQQVCKSAFFAAQLLAYFENDLWILNARHANAMARLLKKVFDKHSIGVICPVDINEIFVFLSEQLSNYLKNSGCQFYSWPFADKPMHRFVTTCSTQESEIEKLEECLANYYGGGF